MHTRFTHGFGRAGGVLLAMLLLSVCLWVQVVHADEILVDDADAAVLARGEWSPNSLTPGFYGSGYRYRVPGDGSATVTWPFPLTAPPGRYEVSARWTSGPNRADDATYQVASNAGSAEVTVNQQANGGVWQSLGQYDFQPGQSHGVTLSDKAHGVVVADAIRWIGPLDAPAQSSPVPTTTQTPAPSPPDAAGGATWTVTLEATDLHAGPDASTDSFGTLPQFSYLQALGYSGEWAYVYNPRTRGTAYVRSALLGPSDPPPAWVTASPPPPSGAMNLIGRTVGAAPVAYYPVDDKFAYTARLGHNASIVVRDSVEAQDGTTWYRTDQGYLAAASVRLPRPPQRTFPGRWIDADLREPAMVVAYEGDRPVMATLTIKGTVANQTPTGVFSIIRRVADETMDSTTVGIPRFSPGGYHLEHVLWTQYFTGDGASLHYNYWSSNWGYAGSHGCLGLPYNEARFLWDWASVGTPVSIHF